MEETNYINNTENVILVDKPTTAYEVACDIHTTLLVLSIFIMAFCMYRFLKGIIRK